MKKYIISSFVPNEQINKQFFACIKNYAKVNNAKIILTRSQENYKDDIISQYNKDLEKELSPYIILKEHKLNNNILISDYRVSQNTMDPASGLDALVSRKGNIIIPFTRQRHKMFPRQLKISHLPRGVWGTGSISMPYSYKNNKSGQAMRQYHVFGALIVEVIDDEIFHIRQIEFKKQGFYDLDTFYEKDKTTKIIPSGIVLGDVHTKFMNNQAVNETKRIIEKLKVPEIVIHDLNDFGGHYNHHNIGKYLLNHAIFSKMEDEFKLSSDFLSSLEKLKCKPRVLITKSNHDEALDKYLEEFRFRDDPLNIETGLILALVKIKGKDPLAYALRKYNKLNQTIFLKRESVYRIKTNLVSDHGDIGSNGSRGNTKQIGIMADGKIISGHTHSPEIGITGNKVVGTLAELQAHYTNASGGSSWLHTNCLIYPDGTSTLINIIFGKTNI